MKGHPTLDKARVATLCGPMCITCRSPLASHHVCSGGQLISCSPGCCFFNSCVRPPAGALLALFQACGLVMRRDVQTGLFLMPYIIHNVLQAGSDVARTEVKQEIHAVLTGGRATKEGELCVQAIFSLLDVLKKFVSDLKEQAAQAEASGRALALCRTILHDSWPRTTCTPVV